MKSTDIWRLFGREPEPDLDIDIVGVCDYSEPRPFHVAFTRVEDSETLLHTRHHSQTIFLVPDSLDQAPANCLLVPNPRLAFAVLSNELATTFFDVGVSPLAVVDPRAAVDPTASIAPFVQVDADATIGAHTRVDSHTRIHSGVKIGAHCRIGTHVSIGGPGFGFEIKDDGEPIRIAHVGGVTVGDRVEIGSHTSIAQGTLRPTTIADDVKIANAVFIAHNVRIGRAAFVIAGATICGSVDIGAGAWISPESTVINQATVGDRALVGLGAVVVGDVPPDRKVAGVPARDRGART